MKCPKCASENTQRLEVAFSSGTQNISTNSRSTGIGIGSGGRLGVGLGSTKTSGQSQSILAQQVAPPAKKSFKWALIGQLVGGVLLSHSLIVGIIIIAISGYFLYSTFQYNSKEWPIIYKHWSESWVCHKCGDVYHQA